MYWERGQASNAMSQHPYNPNNLLMKRQVPWVITYNIAGALCMDSRKKMSISSSIVGLILLVILLQLVSVQYM